MFSFSVNDKTYKVKFGYGVLTVGHSYTGVLYGVNHQSERYD